jgi:hypothetical protein
MNINERLKLGTIDNGPETLAAIDHAIAALPDLEQRAREAGEMAERTKAGRDGLANAALVGLVSKPADIARADKAVADAEAAATVSRDALATGRKAVTDLNAEAVRMIHAERTARFKEACDRRIAAAEELDRLGAAFGRAVAEFADAGAALSPLIDTTEKLEQRLVSLRDRRAAYLTLPERVQNEIVQMGRAAVTGAVLAPRERGLWS